MRYYEFASCKTDDFYLKPGYEGRYQSLTIVPESDRRIEHEVATAWILEADMSEIAIEAVRYERNQFQYSESIYINTTTGTIEFTKSGSSEPYYTGIDCNFKNPQSIADFPGTSFDRKK